MPWCDAGSAGWGLRCMSFGTCTAPRRARFGRVVRLGSMRLRRPPRHAEEVALFGFDPHR